MTARLLLFDSGGAINQLPHYFRLLYTTVYNVERNESMSDNESVTALRREMKSQDILKVN